MISYFLHLNKFEIERLSDEEFEIEKRKAYYLAKLIENINL